jgi:hypothetical protein
MKSLYQLEAEEQLLFSTPILKKDFGWNYLMGI